MLAATGDPAFAAAAETIPLAYPGSLFSWYARRREWDCG